MSVYLRCYGNNLDIDALVTEMKIKPVSVWRKGEQKVKANSNHRKNKNSGASFQLGDSDLEDLQRQIDEAIEFMASQSQEIKKIINYKAIDEALLDFSTVFKDVAAQFEYFPPKLVALAGELGLGIELSHYWSVDD